MRPLTLCICFFVSISSLKAQEWKPVGGRIATLFGETITPDNAWQEYPRPQMERREWINLNGLWDYAIRPASDGEAGEDYEGKILVPFCVESSLSGVGREVGKDNLLWYRRSFEVPSGWKGKDILLHFGAVDYDATVWVNGRKVGEHKGGYSPFSFNITAFLTEEDSQEITVSVWDPTDEGRQPRGKQVNNPGSIWYNAVTGIWQTVWLEPVEKTHISSLYFVPNIDSEDIQFHLDVINSHPGDEILITVKDKGKAFAQAGGSVNQPITVPMLDADLWSPDNPYLYDIEIELLRQGKELDRLYSYCAMRKVSIGENSQKQTAILLNNNPLFLFGTLDQGWWPDGLYTPPSEEAILYDLGIMKEMGFNMLRKHVKTESARFYYNCDRLGLLVWQDMPSGYKTGEEGESVVRSWWEKDWDKPKEDAELFEAELKEMIDHLRFFPSIIMWVNFNEGWGQYDSERIGRWVKEYDPSRLLCAASGWTDRGYGDVLSMHSYPNPCIEPPAKHPGRAVVLSEFGGIGWPIKDHLWFTDRPSGGFITYYNQTDYTNRYIEAFEDLKAARYAGVAAAIYTQNVDVEGEVNGLLTYDRKLMKIDPNTLHTLHAGLYTGLPRVETISADNQLSTHTIELRKEKPLFIEGEEWETRTGKVYMLADEELWFRKTFLVKDKADGYFLSVSARGDVEFYINGHLVLSRNINAGTYYQSINLDRFNDYFHKGENSIVVRVVCGPYPHSFDFGIYSHNMDTQGLHTTGRNDNFTVSVQDDVIHIQANNNDPHRLALYDMTGRQVLRDTLVHSKYVDIQQVNRGGGGQIYVLIVDDSSYKILIK